MFYLVMCAPIRHLSVLSNEHHAQSWDPITCLKCEILYSRISKKLIEGVYKALNIF